MDVHRPSSRFSVPAVLILFRNAAGEARLAKAGWASLVAETGSWLAVPFDCGDAPDEFSIHYLSRAQAAFFAPRPSCCQLTSDLLAGSGLEPVSAQRVAAPLLTGCRLAVECRDGRWEQDAAPPQLVGQIAALHRCPLLSRSAHPIDLLDQDPSGRLKFGGE